SISWTVIPCQLDRCMPATTSPSSSRPCRSMACMTGRRSPYSARVPVTTAIFPAVRASDTLAFLCSRVFAAKSWLLRQRRPARGARERWQVLVERRDERLHLHHALGERRRKALPGHVRAGHTGPKQMARQCAARGVERHRALETRESFGQGVDVTELVHHNE